MSPSRRCLESVRRRFVRAHRTDGNIRKHHGKSTVHHGKRKTVLVKLRRPFFKGSAFSADPKSAVGFEFLWSGPC